MIARNADAVEFGHVAGGVTENIGDNAHGGFGRIDVGVAHHVLFENVILNRARKLVLADSLFFSRNDVEGHDGQNRAVHGHGYGHLIEGDTFKKTLHIDH